MMHFCIYGVVFLHTFCDKSRSAAPHSQKHKFLLFFPYQTKKGAQLLLYAAYVSP